MELLLSVRYRVFIHGGFMIEFPDSSVFVRGVECGARDARLHVR